MKCLKVILYSSLIFILLAPSLIYSTESNVIFHYNTSSINNYPNEEIIDDKKCNVALALSGGGARGLSQIGVIEILDSAGIKPDIIIGTSIGAVIGGLYASGYSPQEMIELTNEIDWQSFFTDISERAAILQTLKESSEKYVVTIRFKSGKPVFPTGYFGAQKLLQKINELTASATILCNGDFNKLSIPFRVVFTDLITGEAIVLSNGNLSQAIRASISIPLIFKPFPLDSYLAVDGGLRMPVPIEVAKDMKCSNIIAINSTADLLSEEQLNSLPGIIEQTTTVMQKDIIALEKETTDFWIEPKLTGQNSIDFSNVDTLIEIGRQAAREIISEIANKVKASTFIKIDSVVFDSNIVDIENVFPIGEVKTSTIKNILDSLVKSGNFEQASCSLIKNSLHIQLKPCRKYYSLEIHGNCIHEKTIKSVIDSFQTEKFSMPIVKNNIKEIIKTYHENGFTLARCDTVLIIGDTISAFINEGIIDGIRWKGNKLTHIWILRSYFSIKPGEPFNNKKIKDSITNLYSTGLFDWVGYELTVSDDNKIILTINLHEKPNMALRFGVRYDERTKTEAALGIYDDNLFGTSLRIGIEGYGGSRRQSLSLAFNADRIWKTTFGSIIAVKYDRDRFDHFSNYRIKNSDWIEKSGVSVSIGPQVRKLGMLLLELEFKEVKVNPFDEGSPKIFRMNKFKAKSVIDTYDKRQFPINGHYLSMNFEMSQDILGGETSFTKYLAYCDIKYTPGIITVSGWGVAGFIAGSPPFFEKFGVGKYHYIWGFRSDEVTTDNIFNLGLDIRLNLSKKLKRLYIICGVAMNNLWNQNDKFEISNGILSSGIGLGLETPIGPVFTRWGRSTEYIDYFSFSVGYNF